MSKRPIKIESAKQGVGELGQTPALFSTALCGNCKTEFHLFGKLFCNCKSTCKLRTKRIYVNDILFRSLGEARRYSKLAWLNSKGIITRLTLQPKFPIRINEQHICTYIGDFQYQWTNKTIIEDFKGMITDTFKLKYRMVRAFYPDLILDLVMK